MFTTGNSHTAKASCQFSEGGFRMGWDYQDLLVVFPDVGTSSCLRKDLGFQVLQLVIPVASLKLEEARDGLVIFYEIKGTICLSSPLTYVHK